MATRYTSKSSDTCKFSGRGKQPLSTDRFGHIQHSGSHVNHSREMNKRRLGRISSPPSLTDYRAVRPSASLASKSKNYTRTQPIKGDHSLMSLATSTQGAHPTPPNYSKPIKFYNWDEPYYQFTNFYRAPVLIDGKKWPTTEHYFQAQKFVGTPYVEVIRCLPTAREAFQRSRDPKVSRWRRSDWNTVKDGIMHKALMCKFMQHPDLRKLLWETGDSELIEHTTNDSYWGDGGGQGRGKNKLGELLMKVRNEIVSVQGQYRPYRKKSETDGGRPKMRKWSSLTDLTSRDVEESSSISGIRNQPSDDLILWKSTPKSSITYPHNSLLKVSHRDKPQFSSAPVNAKQVSHNCKHGLQTRYSGTTKHSVHQPRAAQCHRGDSHSRSGSYPLNNMSDVTYSRRVKALASPMLSRRTRISPSVTGNVDHPSIKPNKQHTSFNPILHKYTTYEI